MVFPKNFEYKIDFEPLRQQLTQFCVSPMGRDRVQALRFFIDRETVVRLLKQTDEMLGLILADNEPPLGNLHDCTAVLRELQTPGRYATSHQLYHIATTLQAADHLRRFLTNPDNSAHTPSLIELAAQFQDFAEILTIINRVVDSLGEVKDNASAQLLEIRRQIASVQHSMSTAIRRAADAAIAQGVIESDTAPVMRDGKLLLPLPASARRSVPGIVYDRSATGKTIFVQPAEIIEAENRMHALKAEENKEIIRILTEVADQIRPYIPALLQCWRMLGIIDFIHAKALLARDIDAQMPKINPDNNNDNPNNNPIELYHAVHPGLLYSMRSQGKEAIPLNLTLNHKNRILLISGPNAGGKSVALKTVAIVQYMTQCGLLPPVRSNSHLSIFRNLLVDLGDEQSIQNDLSTYSSHLANMKLMMRHASSQSLILIDEIGSGTEPVIGAALARSILQEFVDKGAYGIITTHYDSLKQFAANTPGMQNGAMLYDTGKMQPLYRLQQGITGSSFALEIARNTGLPRHVVDRAAKDVGRDYINSERYMQQIARDRKEAHSKRIQLESLQHQMLQQQEKLEQYSAELKQKRQQILAEAKDQAQETLKQANARIENTIREIRQAQADKEKTKEIRRQLQEYTASLERDMSGEKGERGDKRQESSDKRQEIRDKRVETIAPKNMAGAPCSSIPLTRKAPSIAGRPVLGDSLAELSVGDYVKRQSSNIPGRIISIQGNQAEVAFGNLRMKVKTNTLTPTAKPAPAVQQTTLTTQTTNSSNKRQLNFKTTIDLRGMTVDEAIQAATYFIDDAAQFQVSPVRILHGTGTGALRSALRQYLKTIPAVADVRDEDVRLGGAGISVVTLH